MIARGKAVVKAWRTPCRCAILLAGPACATFSKGAAQALPGGPPLFFLRGEK